jgi:glucose/arabinose dehydrogenase
MPHIRRLIALSFLFISLSAAAYSQVPIKLKEGFITGLDTPVFLTNAGDGTRRIFIVEQTGKILVVQPGSQNPEEYVNLSGVVSNSGSELGLLGLAFHPDFESNRRFFVYYTRQPDDAIEIAEYAQDPNNPNIAIPTPTKTIITIKPAVESTHNGGTVAFGPDGYLYAATGDGGLGYDTERNAQDLNSLFGKVLRLDVDSATPPLNYSIPPTNPFAGVTPGADEIYAYGLRNPYRFSFDRGGTNQLWASDVGQDLMEEVNVIVSGGNYGWRVYEGTQCTNMEPELCSTGATPITQIPPVFEYTRVLDRSGINRCSVIGGYVYRGSQQSLPLSSYVYGDFCTGEIMLWNGSQQTILRDTSSFNLVSFGEDEDGEIYVVRRNGSIARIVRSRANGDFDGDGSTDLSVYRPNGGAWYWYSPISRTGAQLQFGLSTDKPVPEDYDGDRRSDIAVFRPSNGVWFILRSSDWTVQFAQWGISTDVPAVGDFTGDGKADVTVYRPEEGRWYIQRSGTGLYDVYSFGLAEDRPVNGDFDGDGKNDVTLWRQADGSWWRINSSNGAVSAFQFGQSGDVPAQADYDGDGRTDEAVYRPATGAWYIRQSSTLTERALQFGISEDIAAPGDYDRDGVDDIAIWRPSSGTWWITRSTNLSYTAIGYGMAGDIPGPSVDRP